MLARRLIAVALVAIVLANATVGGHAEDEMVSELQDFNTRQIEVVNVLQREKRQLRRNPNIFGLLFQLIGETRRDIQRTFNEIARTVESGIVDENTIGNSTASAATSEGEGTSERPRVTRQELTRILSRNWRGLTRLFNQEVEIAVNQSNRNAAEARRAFWDSLAPFLQPATTTARSNTTARSG